MPPMIKSKARHSAKPAPMFCTYRPKKGKEKALLSLVKKHWPALRKAGLATARKAVVYKVVADKGVPYFVEFFEWKNSHAPETAHQHPEVMAVWGPMGEVLQTMEHAEVSPVSLK